MSSGALTKVPDKSVFVDYLAKRLQDNQEKYVSSETLFTQFRTAVINNSPNLAKSERLVMKVEILSLHEGNSLIRNLHFTRLFPFTGMRHIKSELFQFREQ